jgi:hypothetical protein
MEKNNFVFDRRSTSLSLYGQEMPSSFSADQDAEYSLLHAVQMLVEELEQLLFKCQTLNSIAAKLRVAFAKLYALLEDQRYDFGKDHVNLKTSFWSLLGGNRGELFEKEEWLKNTEGLMLLSNNFLSSVTALRMEIMESSGHFQDLKARVSQLMRNNAGISRIATLNSLGSGLERMAREGRFIAPDFWDNGRGFYESNENAPSTFKT